MFIIALPSKTNSLQSDSLFMSEENIYAPPQTSSLPEITSDSSPQLATRGSRLGAALIDSLITLAITIPSNWFIGTFKSTIAYSQQNPSLLKLPNAEALLSSALGLLIFVAINFSLLRKGQTIGKLALGICIVRKDGRPIEIQRIVGLRIIPIQIAALLPVINIIIPLLDCLLIFRKGRNTLHDDIADTKVIIAPENWRGPQTKQNWSRVTRLTTSSNTDKTNHADLANPAAELNALIANLGKVGIGINTQDGRTITSITTGSSAHENGIQVGDLIVAIDGAICEGDYRAVILQLVGDAGSQVEVTVRRGERLNEYVLVRR
jgi:uncharacterized RDD family membrane protein YckC/dUTPase